MKATEVHIFTQHKKSVVCCFCNHQAGRCSDNTVRLCHTKHLKSLFLPDWVQKESSAYSPQSLYLCKTNQVNGQPKHQQDDIHISQSHISVDGLEAPRGNALIWLDVTLIPKSQAPGLISHRKCGHVLLLISDMTVPGTAVLLGF